MDSIFFSGDEVKLSCWFSSGDRNHTVYWGEGSDVSFISFVFILHRNRDEYLDKK